MSRNENEMDEGEYVNREQDRVSVSQLIGDGGISRFRWRGRMLTERIRGLYLGSRVRGYRVGGFAWLLVAGLLGITLYAGGTLLAADSVNYVKLIGTGMAYMIGVPVIFIVFFLIPYAIAVRYKGKKAAWRNVGGVWLFVGVSVITIAATGGPEAFQAMMETRVSGAADSLFSMFAPLLGVMMIIGLARAAMGPLSS